MSYELDSSTASTAIPDFHNHPAQSANGSANANTGNTQKSKRIYEVQSPERIHPTTCKTNLNIPKPAKTSTTPSVPRITTRVTRPVTQPRDRRRYPYLLRGLLRRGRLLPSRYAAEHGAGGDGPVPPRRRERRRVPRAQPPRGGRPPCEQQRRRGAEQQGPRGGRRGGRRRRAWERGHGALTGGGGRDPVRRRRRARSDSAAAPALST
jgi:hypothetical protein